MTNVIEAVQQERAKRMSRGARLWERCRLRVVTLVVFCGVLLMGALQDFYGNTDRGDVYGSDAVQYLDIARAVQRHDWRSTLNPLWSQGYPALLELARPAFAAGAMGDWLTTRVVNLGIFCADILAFLWLVQQLGRVPGFRRVRQDHPGAFGSIALSVFVTTQLCLGEVSRVNPDELVNALFFCVCATLLIVLRGVSGETPVRRQYLGWGALLGLLLGVGFVVKAVFLVLGVAVIGVTGIALWRLRRSVLPLVLAASVFGGIVLSYGAALSHVVGHATLGEAGALNYAWHVNRLQKWVHWEGGVPPADEAWPRPAIARFARWSEAPPDFGVPLHPSAVLQASPRVYGFRAPFQATYPPYYNPPYWYFGYKHLFRWRYQVIALGKNVGDFAVVFVSHPALLLMSASFLLMAWPGGAWRRAAAMAGPGWVLTPIAVGGVALYLPVHLEGRYLAGFLAAGFAVALLAAAAACSKRSSYKIAMVLLCCGVGLQLAVSGRAVVSNAFHGRLPSRNPEWQAGMGVLQAGLPADAPVGVISWTPALHCDWAYIAHVQIQAEIAAPADYDAFWNGTPQVREQTLGTFRAAGLQAVFTADNPRVRSMSGWSRLGNSSMWMYRLR